MCAPKQKIILDTDCGIDDAIALLLALSSEEVSEILAVTTCFGNTSLDQVIENVKRILTVCDKKEIPVHRGSSCPLLDPDLSLETVHGADGLGNCGHKYSTGDITESEIPASMALINLARKHPGQVTVIALGPLTNLAIAHRIDPSFFSNLKSVVMMGGSYKGIGNITEVAEFNFYCDSESANIVLTEAKAKMVLMPWETTLECGIPWDHYYQLIKTPTKKGRFFKDITEMFVENSKKKKRNGILDCDFEAVAACLYPDCITSSLTNRLYVEWKGRLTRGLTILLTKPVFREQEDVTIITGCDTHVLKQLRFKMLA